MMVSELGMLGVHTGSGAYEYRPSRQKPRLDTKETTMDGWLSGPPLTARAIHARLNQIMFTAPLNHDLDQFAELQRMARDGTLGGPLGRRLVEARLHVIEGGKDLQAFGQSSKLNAHRGFLQELHGLGRQRAEAWLGERSGPAPEQSIAMVASEEPCPQQ